MESLLFAFLVMDLHCVGNSEIAFLIWQVHALCLHTKWPNDGASAEGQNFFCTQLVYWSLRLSQAPQLRK